MSHVTVKEKNAHITIIAGQVKEILLKSENFKNDKEKIIAALEEIKKEHQTVVDGIQGIQDEVKDFGTPAPSTPAPEKKGK